MFSKKLLPMLLILVLSLSILPARAQDSGGVINTNLPAPGGTQAGMPLRASPVKYGDYSNMETDPTAVTADERDAALATFAQGNQTAVSVLNSWNDAKEGAPSIQAVNNMPISGSLYTVVLPAGWTKTAKLPVVLYGDGIGQSNNDTLWKAQNGILLNWVTASSINGHTGLIAAYSNVGGTESWGVDDHTLKSVGAFFDFIAQNGGDPTRAIMTGFSRGATAALVWAANPMKLNYNTIAVFADAPLADLSQLQQRSVQTYPALGSVYVLVTHDPNEWQYFVAGPQKGAGALNTILTGTSDRTQLLVHSPMGMVAMLKGKQVAIAHGAHDAYFPLADFIAFDHALTDSGISHAAVITYGQGQTATKALWDQAGQYLDALTQGKDYQIPAGRSLYVNQLPPDGDQTALPGDTKALPFSAEFPEKAGAGLPMDVSVCGAIGTTFTLAAKDASGTAAFQQNGVIDASECAMFSVMAPATPGDYTWDVTVNGKPIPAINTPVRNEGGCGLSAVTTVSHDQPAPDSPLPNIGFGLDEISAQDPGCSGLS